MGKPATTYQVDGPAFVDPTWFAEVRHGQHAATIRADGSLVLKGVLLQLRGLTPAPGTEVRIWLNNAGCFVYAALPDLQAAASAPGQAAAG